ncbi:MAG TPA: flagellar motor switch protein FliN [Euzebyales bacterium]|nr:flagellar motor switch protein FliN [Euzebyales bacterium]
MSAAPDPVEPDAESAAEPVAAADAEAAAAAAADAAPVDTAAADAGVMEALAEAVADAEQPGVAPVELGELEAGGVGDVGNLGLLRDIELTVTVEIGRARMRVRDLLGLHEGSVVELDRPVGSPVDLLANGRTIARGEIVLVDDQLGIRVTGFNVDHDGG